MSGGTDKPVFIPRLHKFFNRRESCSAGPTDIKTQRKESTEECETSNCKSKRTTYSKPGTFSISLEEEEDQKRRDTVVEENSTAGHLTECWKEESTEGCETSYSNLVEDDKECETSYSKLGSFSVEDDKEQKLKGNSVGEENCTAGLTEETSKPAMEDDEEQLSKLKRNNIVDEGDSSMTNILACWKEETTEECETSSYKSTKRDDKEDFFPKLNSSLTNVLTRWKEENTEGYETSSTYSKTGSLKRGTVGKENSTVAHRKEGSTEECKTSDKHISYSVSVDEEKEEYAILPGYLHMMDESWPVSGSSGSSASDLDGKSYRISGKKGSISESSVKSLKKKKGEHVQEKVERILSSSEDERRVAKPEDKRRLPELEDKGRLKRLPKLEDQGKLKRLPKLEDKGELKKLPKLEDKGRLRRLSKPEDESKGKRKLSIPKIKRRFSKTKPGGETKSGDETKAEDETEPEDERRRLAESEKKFNKETERWKKLQKIISRLKEEKRLIELLENEVEILINQFEKKTEKIEAMKAQKRKDDSRWKFKMDFRIAKSLLSRWWKLRRKRDQRLNWKKRINKRVKKYERMIRCYLKAMYDEKSAPVIEIHDRTDGPSGSQSHGSLKILHTSKEQDDNTSEIHVILESDDTYSSNSNI